MKNLLSFLSSILILVFLASCTTTRSISTMEGSYEGMEVFTAKFPEKEFQEIKFIEVQGGWFTGTRGLMEKLEQRARKSGADRLVNVQYNTLHIGSTIS